MNIPDKYNDFLVIRSCDWVQDLEILQEDGVTPLNLTGYTAGFDIRPTYGTGGPLRAVATITNASLGQVQIVYDEIQTASLKPGAHVFTFTLTANNITEPYLIGNLLVV